MSLPSTSTVLITGATGNTGSALLQLLEERGVPVRAIVRHERDVARLRNPSASIVIGDFDDANSVAAALDGVNSATVTRLAAELEQLKQELDTLINEAESAKSL